MTLGYAPEKHGMLPDSSGFELQQCLVMDDGSGCCLGNVLLQANAVIHLAATPSVESSKQWALLRPQRQMRLGRRVVAAIWPFAATQGRPLGHHLACR